jgi:AcrR family transcriptional regulator
MTERQERGQADILEAAAGLLARGGYHGMSMRDLAKASSMSLANMYNYFPSKEAVLEALQLRAFETLLSTTEGAVGSVEGPEAGLYAFILNHVRYVATHGDVMRVLVEEAGEIPPKRRKAIRALKERYFEMGRERVRAVLAEGVDGNVSGPDEPADAAELDRITFSLFGMLNWIYGWYRPEDHGRPRDVARTIHRLALFGLVGRAPQDAVHTSTERLVDRVELPSPIRRARKGVA